jgi:hypothetical protein
MLTVNTKTAKIGLKCAKLFGESNVTKYRVTQTKIRELWSKKLNVGRLMTHPVHIQCLKCWATSCHVYPPAAKLTGQGHITLHHWKQDHTVWKMRGISLFDVRAIG